MGRIVHFEFYCDDPQRAASFYENALGWKVEKWDGPVDYWLLTTGDPSEPGIDGAVALKSEGYEQTINTVDVDSVDDVSAKVIANGGEVIRQKQPVPGVGWLAYCKDTEGNIFGLMQSDPEAR